MANRTAVEHTTSRLISLDALRGFTMFWIIGADAVVRALSELSANSGAQAVAIQFFEHVEWEGFRFYDLIFPMFLFVIGATIPFALGRRMEAGGSKIDLLKKVAVRTLILFGLGLIYNGLLRFEGWQELRFVGVLPRLALGYAVASVAFLYGSKRTQAILTGAILVIYWVLMARMPVPGFPLGTYSPEGNFANYVDRILLAPGQMYEPYGDPEGLVSTLPSFATALMGLLAGQLLRREGEPTRKALQLAAWGGASIAVGLLWSPAFPIIKKLWTSSYVLVAGGCSLLLLAAFYAAFDILRWRKLAFPFVVIGSNAILIYMLTVIVDFRGIANFFVGGLLEGHKTLEPLGLALGALAVEWLLLYGLYRNRIFVRV